MSTSLVEGYLWAAAFCLDGWLVCGWCLLARGEETHKFSLRRGFLRVFSLHVDQSAWGGTLVTSLLRVYGLLHRRWSKRVKGRKNRRALQADLQQNSAYNPFSDE